MEREPKEASIKLTVVASIDYPEATEVLVSFPDKWDFVDHVSQAEETLYVGAMPPEVEPPRRRRFHGLPGDLNETLITYRLYKLFQPWPMPRLNVLWDATAGQGSVTGMGDLKLQLQPVGQAQLWQSASAAVIWECYLRETARQGDWQERLAAFWRVVERDTTVATLYTQPFEPTFEVGYPDFLGQLGYGPDRHHVAWWRKSTGGRSPTG